MYRQFKRNRLNDGKNAFAMNHLVVADSFPGVEIDPKLSWFRWWYLYISRVFGAQSLKSTAWVAPMRQEIFERYLQLNVAITKGNARRLDSFAMDPYLDEATMLALQKQTGYTFCWNFHREVSPTRILSLRVADGEYGKEIPVTGSRVGIQALVRFDTEQSLEIYDNNGRALHTLAPGTPPQPPRIGKKIHYVPAAPTRVIEYLIADKALYDPDGKWRFRERYHPEPGRTVAV
ncbi:hypothetical protein DFH06DRAFT_984788 [Mycena polygramma]|nr:hypothetical protein DFH06DRAFT_984788 [Mycena polygramma]